MGRVGESNPPASGRSVHHRASAGSNPCAACGGLSAGLSCRNRLCNTSLRSWTVAFAVGDYSGALRRAVICFKSTGKGAQPLVDMFESYMVSHGAWFEEFDTVLAVPSYRGAHARRPWDPIGSLHADLGTRLGSMWDFDCGVLEKRVETPPMHGLSESARQRMARSSLRRALTVARPESVTGRRILLMDDVMAGGNTLEECASALMRGGATEVSGLVLARANWHRCGSSGRSFDQ